MPDLPPELAASVASNLLSNKSSTEHARVLERVPSLAKWNQLLIALADRTEDGSLTDEHLQSLMTVLLGSDLRLAAGKEGHVTARRELFQFVMRRLATGTAPAKPPVSVSENAASLLANAYATQARLLGVSLSDSVVKGRDPQATLRAMIDEYLSRLTSAKWPDAQRADLARVPHELTALEFVVGTNEVQRMVSLERIWLRLLAFEAARRNEARTIEARELVTSLQQKDRQSKHVLSSIAGRASGVVADVAADRQARMNDAFTGTGDRTHTRFAIRRRSRHGYRRLQWRSVRDKSLDPSFVGDFVRCEASFRATSRRGEKSPGGGQATNRSTTAG